MEYLIVKTLHILSSTFLFGTGVGTAFFMLFTSLGRDVASVATVSRLVVRADWLFTPNVGAGFGGDASGREHLSWGASLGWMGAGVLGFEADFAFTPEFFEAEDNDLDAALIETFLSDFDLVHVLRCKTAAAALLCAQSAPPAVIISDIDLPDMSGIALLARLRAAPETRYVPVIAVASASRVDRVRAKHAGFFRYLEKPVQLVALERALAQLMPLTLKG